MLGRVLQGWEEWTKGGRLLPFMSQHGTGGERMRKQACLMAECQPCSSADVPRSCQLAHPCLHAASASHAGMAAAACTAPCQGGSFQRRGKRMGAGLHG